VLQVQGRVSEAADPDGVPLPRGVPGAWKSTEQRRLCQRLQLPSWKSDEPGPQVLRLVIPPPPHRSYLFLLTWPMTVAHQSLSEKDTKNII
jgi:hypothetical protein